MLGLALALRKSWTHSLLPFSDAMYKAVWPFYVYVKGQITNKFKYKWHKNDKTRLSSYTLLDADMQKGSKVTIEYIQLTNQIPLPRSHV